MRDAAFRFSLKNHMHCTVIEYSAHSCRLWSTRFWNALEVYSSMGRVPESEVYRGA